MRFTLDANPLARPVVPKACQVDVILFTCSKDEENRQLTQRALRSLRASEPAGTFRVFVVEQFPQAPDYPEADVTARPAEACSYTRALNAALRQTRAPYVAVVHNDVEFHEGWWSLMLQSIQKFNLDTASPRSPRKQRGMQPNVEQAHRETPEDQVSLGYIISHTFCQWCYVLSRKAVNFLFPLDEGDNYITHIDEICWRLAHAGFEHGMVSMSKVSHDGDKPSYKLIPPIEIPVGKPSQAESSQESASRAAEPQVTMIATAFKRFDTLLGLICAMNLQTRSDWRLHIVSDGRDPDLEERIRPYLSEKIRWSHVEGEDGKPVGDWGFTASNSALWECDTPYVCFTSDDNYYVPLYVEYMLGALERHQLDIVSCKALHNYVGYKYAFYSYNELRRGLMDKGQFIARTDLVKKAGGIVGKFPWADGVMIERIVSQNPDLRAMELESCLYIHN